MEHVCVRYGIVVSNVRHLIFLIMLVSEKWNYVGNSKTIDNKQNLFKKTFQINFYFLSTGVSSVFYFVAIVSLIQLLVCIVSEHQRLKQPSFLRACRLTTQKLLYFVVFIAALLRGAYFTTPVSLTFKFFILSILL